MYNQHGTITIFSYNNHILFKSRIHIVTHNDTLYYETRLVFEVLKHTLY